MAYKYCMDKQYKDSIVVVNGFGCGSGNGAAASD
jgi:hypothetical protein